MNEQDEPLFLPAPFFMIRTPLLPFENYLSYFENTRNDQKSPLSLLQAPVKEAIAIASSSLDKTMKAKNGNNQLASLLKYFNRMTTRSTPFGLFSFVSNGSWSSSTSIQFDTAKVRKRARPDMEWLLTLINQLCADPSLLPYLSIQRNPLIVESGGRVYLHYYRKEKKEDKSPTISIRSSSLTQSIFAHTIQPIKLNELLKKILHQNPSLIEEKVKEVIEQLIKKQYLSLNIIPSLLTESPFVDLISKLSATPASIAHLKEIKSMIDTYNQTGVGLGIENLLQLQQWMGQVAETSNFLQVDAISHQDGNQLSHRISKDLAEAAEVLWRLSSENSHSFIKDYHKKFLERYGVCRTVPLLDLLYKEGGLGIPEIYKEKRGDRLPASSSNWKKWINQQWIHCLNKGSYEIEITEEALKETLEKRDKNKALLSFDLYFEIIANSYSEIDQGDYLLHLVNHSLQAGATFGRFLDILGEKTQENLKTLYLQEEALQKGGIFVQTSYLSYSSRSANVTISPNLRKNVLDLSGIGNISLHQLYVGATNERLYITLEDGQKELVFTTGNMLNPAAAPIPLRFIRDVCSENYQPINLSSWIQLPDYSPFLPRIRFKKVILSPACWKVDLSQLNLTEKESLEKIQEEFQSWAKIWKMPRYVFIGESDQKILLDIQHPAHLLEIAAQIKKGLSVKLSEKIGQEKGQWIKSEKGTHLCEFVLPFIKNPKYPHPPLQRLNSLPHHKVSLNERWKLPGSEWLYAKIYLNLEEENRFLIDHFLQFKNHLVDREIISDCFFIRYTDTKSHLRFRFRTNKELVFSQLIPLFHSWTQYLLEEGYIHEVALSSYEREVERYGGTQLIEEAEALFCSDSLTSLSLIKGIETSKLGLNETIISALSLVDFLNGMGLGIKEQLFFYSFKEISKKDLAGFREHKPDLISYMKALLQGNLESYSEEGALLFESFNKRKMFLKAFANKMKEQEIKKQLTMPIHTIQDSLLHMHCNRLLGNDNLKEIKARLYASHALTIIDQMQKNLLRSRNSL